MQHFTEIIEDAKSICNANCKNDEFFENMIINDIDTHDGKYIVEIMYLGHSCQYLVSAKTRDILLSKS